MLVFDYSRRFQRPIGRRLAAMTAVAAVAGAAVMGVVGLRPDPAFAVERWAEGDIAVTVVKLVDADDLERALTDTGIMAEVIHHADALKPSDLDDGSRRGTSITQKSAMYSLASK